MSTTGSPKKMGSLIWNTCVGNDIRLTARNPASRDRTSTSANAKVAPVPPTLTNVVKNPFAVACGMGCPAFNASTLSARYCRNTGATMASMVLSPLTPTDQRRVTAKA